MVLGYVHVWDLGRPRYLVSLKDQKCAHDCKRSHARASMHSFVYQSGPAGVGYYQDRYRGGKNYAPLTPAGALVCMCVFDV